MNFWPFTRPPPGLRIRNLRRDVDELTVELIEVRETMEKTFAAVKRIQGKTYRRKRADMEAVQLEAAAPDGGEPAAETPSPVNGVAPPLHTVQFPQDPKRELRRRAALMRGR